MNNKDLDSRRVLAAVDTQFGALLEATPDALVVLGGEQRILLLNARAESLFGYAREQLIGQSIEVLIPERFRGRHAGHVARYCVEPQVRPMGPGLELFAQRSDGTEFPVEISLSPLETPEGLVVLSAIRDITERRRADDRFRSLMESAPDAVVIADQDGRIVLVNQQAERVFGYSRDELLGQPVEVLLPERFKDRHPAHRRAYTASPNVREMGSGLELYGRRSDGEEFPVEISLSPLETAEGLLVTSNIRDVSERKKALNALRQSEERFRSAFEHSPIAMCLLTLDGRFLQVNRAVCEFTGYSERELLSSRFDSINHADDLRADAAHLQVLVDGAAPSFQLEQRYVHKEGRILWGLASVSLVRGAEDQPLHFIRQIRDVTEQRCAEEERARLLESERQKTEQLVLAIREAHHRIKNNLQAITDLLSLELASSREPEALESLRESIERIGAIALVHDFLSRDQNLERVDAHRVVQHLVPMVLRSSGLSTDTVQVTVEVSPVSLPSKQATALALVVNELVSNAAKHAFSAGRTGHLRVTLTEERGEGLLLVEDDGTGLRADFDPVGHANVGLQVAVTLTEYTLDGSLTLTSPGGVRAEVRFPLEPEPEDVGTGGDR